MRKEGLEPSRFYPQVPETCASTSSATFAGERENTRKLLRNQRVTHEDSRALLADSDALGEECDGWWTVVFPSLNARIASRTSAREACGNLAPKAFLQCHQRC